MKNIRNLVLIMIVAINIGQAQSKADYSIFKTNMTLLIDNWVDPVGANDSEKSVTWLPELGIRGKYYANQKTLSIVTVASVVAEPLFVSGPHEEEMDYANGADFGHYNPKFLEKVEILLAKTLKDKSFKKKAQALYDSTFKNYARCYWSSYQEVLKDKAVKNEYLKGYRALIKEGAEDAGFQIQQSFNDIALKYEEKGLDWYEFTVTSTFWLRRAMDGTDEGFYSLLSLVMKTFDKGYM
jgi:hypothetical protein